ncbi:GntR family transcriptional regulator [Gemmatimonas sp.]|uniref:GntR family transcriptional regulator n=1 Tax=Gemmatimonas sp. TaxID=1962908 RepID=UPI0035673C0F
MAERPAALAPQSLQEAILVHVRQMLLEGILAPGEKIDVDAIARDFGISPPPVREALKQLQAERVVSWAPRKGFRVAKLSFADFSELQHITTVLEAEAIRLGVPRLTDADIAQMTSQRERMEQARSAQDMWTQIVAHREMHFVPYIASGMSRLVEEIQRFWEHTDHYRVLYLYKGDADQEVSLHQHVDIIEACEQRDVASVIALMDEHRTFAMTHMRTGMEFEERL